MKKSGKVNATTLKGEKLEMHFNGYLPIPSISCASFKGFKVDEYAVNLMSRKLCRDQALTLVKSPKI